MTPRDLGDRQTWQQTPPRSDKSLAGGQGYLNAI